MTDVPPWVNELTPTSQERVLVLSEAACEAARRLTEMGDLTDWDIEQWGDYARENATNALRAQVTLALDRIKVYSEMAGCLQAIARTLTAG